MGPLTAGAAYFVIVFAAAFALGVLRTSFVVPAIGAVWAILAELPIVLIVSWVTCGWITRRWDVSSTPKSIAMSTSAFVLLMCAEIAGSSLIFGVALRDQIRLFGTVAGALGLAGQILFGLFPVVQYLGRKAGRLL